VIASATDGISIILLCIPLGMASGAIYPSVLTILMNFSGKRTAMATGLITAATGLGANVFTAMTGFLVDIFGFRNALVILASFFMISIISVLQVKHLLIRLGKRKD
jgi:MFS family permease